MDKELEREMAEAADHYHAMVDKFMAAWLQEYHESHKPMTKKEIERLLYAGKTSEPIDPTCKCTVRLDIPSDADTERAYQRIKDAARHGLAL